MDFKPLKVKLGDKLYYVSLDNRAVECYVFSISVKEDNFHPNNLIYTVELNFPTERDYNFFSARGFIPSFEPSRHTLKLRSNADLIYARYFLTELEALEFISERRMTRMKWMQA